MCEHDGCSTVLAVRVGGRPARFCEVHQGGKYAAARSRAARKVEEPRPQCCIDAGRVGGRTSCPQHKDLGLGDVGAGAPWDDYAGALPKAVRRNRPELPPPGTWHIDDGRGVYGQWTTEAYEFDSALRGTPIRVIGQGREDVKAWMAANDGWDL